MKPAPSRAPDRRQRKSRAALHQALLSLIATKPYDTITIDDVTQQADVARATFYAHYKDKEALLTEATHELISELAGRVAALTPPEDLSLYTGAAVQGIFEHAQEHRHLYRLLISGEGVATARIALVDALEGATTAVLARFATRPGGQLRVPLSASSTAFVGALLLTLERWLGKARRKAPAALAAEFVQAQVGGLEWALGYAPGATRFVPDQV